MGQVQMKVEGLRHVDISDLNVFQGGLKDLSTENYERLKGQIVRQGFSFPMFVWVNDGQMWLIDGHQRLRVLTKMREEGVDVPEVPVVVVQADSYKEAKEKLLSAASQYGEVTSQGLYEYLAESGIDWREAVESFRLPEIDWGEFAAGFYGETEFSGEGKVGSVELDESEFQQFDHVCPKCSFGWNDGDKDADK